MKRGIPCLNYNGSWIGPLTVGVEEACYFCMMKDETILESIAFTLPQKQQKHIAAFAPRMSISSSLAVWEMVRYFLQLSNKNFLQGKVVMLDTLFYTNHKVFVITKDQNCAYCTNPIRGVLWKN